MSTSRVCVHDRAEGNEEHNEGEQEVCFLVHMDPCFASTLHPPEDEKPRSSNQTRSYIKDENENESERASTKKVNSTVNNSSHCIPRAQFH